MRASPNAAVTVMEEQPMELCKEEERESDHYRKVIRLSNLTVHRARPRTLPPAVYPTATQDIRVRWVAWLGKQHLAKVDQSSTALQWSSVLGTFQSRFQGRYLALEFADRLAGPRPERLASDSYRNMLCALAPDRALFRVMLRDVTSLSEDQCIYLIEAHGVHPYTRGYVGRQKMPAEAVMRELEFRTKRDVTNYFSLRYYGCIFIAMRVWIDGVDMGLFRPSVGDNVLRVVGQYEDIAVYNETVLRCCTALSMDAPSAEEV